MRKWLLLVVVLTGTFARANFRHPLEGKYRCENPGRVVQIDNEGLIKPTALRAGNQFIQFHATLSKDQKGVWHTRGDYTDTVSVPDDETPPARIGFAQVCALPAYVALKKLEGKEFELILETPADLRDDCAFNGNLYSRLISKCVKL